MFGRHHNPKQGNALARSLHGVGRGRELMALGRQTAQAMLDQNLLGADGPRTWGELLQCAADHSDQDREMLRIADEIHVVVGDIRTATGVRLYALSTICCVTGTDVTSFLLGMLEQAATEGAS